MMKPFSEPSVLAGQEDGTCHPCPKYRGQFHHHCDCEKVVAGSEHDGGSPEGPGASGQSSGTSEPEEKLGAHRSRKRVRTRCQILDGAAWIRRRKHLQISNLGPNQHR